MSNPSEEWAAQLKVVETASDGSQRVKVVRRTAQDFKFLGELGEGSYSTVMLAKDIHTERLYAVKVLEKRHIVKEKKVKYVTIEKDALNTLGRHHGVVHLFFTFQDEFSLYFVLDYAPNGELLTLIKKYGSLNEDVTRYYLAQILDALKYIHLKGIIHRDLKPENILIGEDFQIQITDFGTAKFMEKHLETNKFVDRGDARSFVGTAEYVSPELLNDKSVGKPCDVWAMGCIIFQMIAGRPPFKATNDYLTFQQVMKVKYAFSAGFPSVVRDLVKRILVANPEERPTLKELEKHYFFDGIDWKNTDSSVWYSPPPELGPYKMSVQLMKPMPSLSRPGLTTSYKTKKEKPKDTKPAELKQKSLKPKDASISANAAVIALSKLSLDKAPPPKKHQRHSSSNAIPQAPKRGVDLRMKYHDEKPGSALSQGQPPKSKQKRLVSLPSSPLLSTPTSPVQSPKTKKPPRKLSPLDAEWLAFLKRDEHVLKNGVLYVKFLTTDTFEKRFRGKLANTPLYYKGQRLNGMPSLAASYSLLSQMVHGNGKSGLRSDYSSTSSADSSKAKSELEATGMLHHVKTPEIEQLQEELDQQESPSAEVKGNVLKKFLKSTKTAIGINLGSGLDFHSSRMVIVTSGARLLVLGKKQLYIKGVSPNDALLRFELLTEIDLAHPSVKFKEVITDNNAKKAAAPQLPTSPSEDRDMPFYFGIFAVMTCSMTALFQVDKMAFNAWTESLVESRI